ncbi:MAG: hypothetical protein IPM25_19790 [Chloracidobacterium sp.]|nr:hypothetical protein [Chloracidobacterium sp.]
MTLSSKVSIQRLNTKEPPLGEDGGRIVSNAGEIAQIVSGGTGFRYLAYIDFTESKFPRGNHYHRNKEEHMYLIRGGLIAVYEDIDSKERKQVTLTEGDLVSIKPMCAHVYFPIEYTQIVEFAADPFDSKDTEKYIVASDFTELQVESP